MKLQCPRAECSYVWDYHGKHPFVATCPHCLTKMRIEKAERRALEKDIEVEAHD